MSDGTPGDFDVSNCLDYAIDAAAPGARARRIVNTDLYRIEMTIALLIDAVRRLARDPNDEIYREEALALSRRAGQMLLSIRS